MVFADFSENSNEQFLQQLHQSRKTTDLLATKWATLSESKQAEMIKDFNKSAKFPRLGDYFDLNAIKFRTINYTVNLNHPLAKVVKTTEQQYLFQHDSNLCFVLHTEAKNSGPPYSDCFLVNTTWCVTSVFEGTRIVIQFKISWVKSAFGINMIKGTIEKAAQQGVIEYIDEFFSQLEKFMDDGFIRRIKQVEDDIIGGSSSNNNIPLVISAHSQDIPTVEKESMRKKSINKRVLGLKPPPEPTVIVNENTTTIREASTVYVHNLYTSITQMSTRTKLVWIILFILIMVLIVQGMIIFRMYKLEINLQEVERATEEILRMSITNRQYQNDTKHEQQQPLSSSLSLSSSSDFIQPSNNPSVNTAAYYNINEQSKLSGNYSMLKTGDSDEL